MKFGIPCVVIVLLAASISLDAQTRPSTSGAPSITAVPIARQPAQGYVGAEACRSCHKPEFQEFGKTAHATLPDHKNSVAGCENVPRRG